MIVSKHNRTANTDQQKVESARGKRSRSPANRLNSFRTLRLNANIYDQIKDTVGSLPAEHGGMLGGDFENGIVTHFVFDKSASRSSATYSPDYQVINRVLKQDWNPSDIRLQGFVHSHPIGSRRPSPGDEIYAKRILDHNKEQEFLWLPIVMSEADNGEFELLPFVAERAEDGVSIIPANLEIVDQVDTEPEPIPMAFQRVKEAYNLRHLARCRIIIVGVGGAVSFIEELARTGIVEFVFIDKDIVSETNIATQQVYRKDIGRPKVECLAERIRDINPNASVFSFKLVLDEISDPVFQWLATASLGNGEPANTLLCGLTDSFEAQARINRLALNFGIPSLSAQVYWEGRAAEVTFTHPDVTPACQRCVLRSRYSAYLEKDFQNNVTSDGTPIFATTRLNSLKGFIAMALLHHGTDHPRWGKLLKRIGNRNLIQVRMDPDLGQTLKLGVFDRVFGKGDTSRILFDDAVWLPQKPDNPENGFPACPECGGTGDLSQAMGTFKDTKVMKRS